jgi:tetratricopeptide (TPR) repeat protein
LIDLGEYDLAIRSFDAVTDKRPKDFLAVALALLRAGDLDRAEKTLFDATRDKPDTIYFIDVLNLQRLLEEIRQSRPFRYVGQEYFDTLTGQLAGANTDRPTGKVDTASFCAVPVDF